MITDRFLLVLRPADRQRLDRLAELTERSRAGVVRALIRTAAQAVEQGHVIETFWPPPGDERPKEVQDAKD